MKQKVVQLLFALGVEYHTWADPKMYFIKLLKGAFCGYSLFPNLENVLNHI